MLRGPLQLVHFAGENLPRYGVLRLAISRPFVYDILLSTE